SDTGRAPPPHGAHQHSPRGSPWKAAPGQSPAHPRFLGRPQITQGENGLVEFALQLDADADHRLQAAEALASVEGYRDAGAALATLAKDE
ncbi:hypothetical protein ACFU7Y_39375, partial [Kitasatospora sp. NPDC057542]|uniref:hypothetical protein n=1 Tax=Kitasatospora sp. NPDC057542 TaxID=3346162 RepID=UPI00367B3D63